MKKKILSAILAVVMVLSVVVVVPSLYTVETEAFDVTSGTPFDSSTVFTAAELWNNGYSINQGTASWSGSKGIKVVTSSGYTQSNADPFITFNSINVAAGTYPYVVVVWSFDNCTQGAAVWGFYLNNATPGGKHGYSELQSGSSSLHSPNDGQNDYYHTFTTDYYYTDCFNLAGLTTGTVSSFRLDWVTNPIQAENCSSQQLTFYIDSIGFFSTQTAANAYATERHVIRNNQSSYDFTKYMDAATLGYFFDQGSNNCSVSTNKIDGISFSASSSNDPNITMQLSLPVSRFKYMCIVVAVENRFASDLNFQIFSQVDSSGFAEGTSYKFITEQESTVYYCQAVPIYALHGSGDTLLKLRFDPNASTTNVKHISFHDTWENCRAQAISECSGAGMSMYYIPKGSEGGINGNGAGDISSLLTFDTSQHVFNAQYGSTASFPAPTSTPSRTGYSFTGWTVTGGTSTSALTATGGTFSVPVSQSTVSTLTVNANWSLNWGTVNIDVSNNLTNNAPAADQSYLFTVSGTGYDGSSFTTTVAIIGNSRATFYLPAGQYTVTCVDGWSWRYSATAAGQDASFSSGGSTVSYAFNSKNEKWLNGFGSYTFN